MPLELVNAAFEFNGGTAIKKKCQLPRQRGERPGAVPGRNANGKLDPEGPRAGGRYFQLDGLQFEDTGQESATVPMQNEQLYKAAGWLRSGTIGTGLTYTLGDFHASTDSPAGDLVRLTSCAAYFDGEKHPGGSLIADHSGHFVAGMIPFSNFDLMGLIADADAVTTPGSQTTSETAAAVPSLTAALAIGQPWYGSTIATTGFSVSAVREVHFALNNKRTLLPSGSGKFGYAAPTVNGREVHLTVLGLKGANQTNENMWYRGTQGVFGWTYVAGVAAGGSVLNTLTYSFTGTLTQLPDMQDIEGNWCSALDIQMDPSTPMTIVTS